jgi:hypothetical protein
VQTIAPSIELVAPALAFADVLGPWWSSAETETGDFRRGHRSMQERAQMSVSIGDDSLPGPWDLAGPLGPNPRKPNKTGGLTDSCSEPSKQRPAPTAGKSRSSVPFPLCLTGHWRGRTVGRQVGSGKCRAALSKNQFQGGVAALRACRISSRTRTGPRCIVFNCPHASLGCALTGSWPVVRAHDLVIKAGGM